MKELKKCPFCGGEAMLIYDEILKGWFVCCGNINCKIEPHSWYYDAKEDAIEAWNRRVE